MLTTTEHRRIAEDQLTGGPAPPEELTALALTAIAHALLAIDEHLEHLILEVRR